MKFDRLFAIAKSKNVSELEVYFANNEGFDVALFEGEIDSYKVSESTTLALRGIYEGKMGYAVSENIKSSNYEFLIDRLIDNAKIMGSTFVETIFAGSEKYKRVSYGKDDFNDYSVEDKVNALRSIESAAKNYDPRITKINHCRYDEKRSTVELYNTKGLKLKRQLHYGRFILAVVAQDGDSTKSVFDYQLANKFADLNPQKLVESACKEALAGLNPQKIKSKKYPVILRNDVAGAILEAFEPVFSGDSAVKGLTWLKDKKDQVIGSSKVTIIDNPTLKDAIVRIPFDDEGVACMEKKVVDKGVFKLFLNNLKTAAKLNEEPTGNGFKGSPASSVGVSCHNFYIRNGRVSYDDMVKSLKEGVIITDVAGLHSGVNTVSGDFSVQSSGFYVKDGKIVHPVTLIVLSGNFYEMLKQVDKVGNDLRFDSSSIGSPSLKIKKMSISS